MLQMSEFFVRHVWALSPCLWETGLRRWWTMQKAGLLSPWNLLLPPLNTSHACRLSSCPRAFLVLIVLPIPPIIRIWKGFCWTEVEPMRLHNGCLAFQGLAAACLMPTSFIRITLPKHCSYGEQMSFLPASLYKLGSSLPIRNELLQVLVFILWFWVQLIDARWEKQAWVTFAEL